MALPDPPTWKRWDTYPPYQAFLQQAAGASVIDLTTASSVTLLAVNTVNTATTVLIRGKMTVASAVMGYVTYTWGGSDLSWADTYNAEYEILWQAGGKETVPNDHYDQFTVMADLENI
jgi:hypothetical protein